MATLALAPRLAACLSYAAKGDVLPPSGQLLPIRFGGPAQRLIDTGCLEVKTQFQREYGDVHWINRRCDSPVKEHKMSRRFAHKRPQVGGSLPHDDYGRLVGEFQFSSHVPLRGGRNTGRHIYLSVKVDNGPNAGIYECAVNIRSDEGTEVQYAERIEDLDSGGLPELGFQDGLHLAYGSGTDQPGQDFMGLQDSDFNPIVNDDLYNRIADLSQNCDRIAAYGVTYSEGDGIHDIHMNSGTEPGDQHADQDRDRQDGAIAFYFNMSAAGQQKSFATWVFIKFTSQHVVEF